MYHVTSEQNRENKRSCGQDAGELKPQLYLHPDASARWQKTTDFENYFQPDYQVVKGYAMLMLLSQTAHYV
jgi:hypothetical protein